MEYSIISLTRAREANQAFLDLFQLLTLSLVLSLRSLFLLKESLGAVFELSLHLILVDLDPVFVSLHGALVLYLHLTGLSLSKFDLLLHQSTILFKVDVFVVEFVFTGVKF